MLYSSGDGDRKKARGHGGQWREGEAMKDLWRGVCDLCKLETWLWVWWEIVHLGEVND